MLCSDFAIECEDYRDDCRTCKYRGKDRNGERKRYSLFFLMDKVCDSLAEKWGTRSASMIDHFRIYHQGDDCKCITNDWWTKEERERVIAAVEKLEPLEE